MFVKKGRLSAGTAGLCALLFLLLLLNSSCAPKRKLLSPKVQLSNLIVKDVNFSHINYSAEISIYNPNLTALEIDGIEYVVYLNGFQFMDGAEQLRVKIPPHSTQKIPVLLSGSIFNVLQLLSTLSDKPSIDLLLKGSVYGQSEQGQEFDIPFEEKTKIDFSKLDPGVTLR